MILVLVGPMLAAFAVLLLALLIAADRGWLTRTLAAWASHRLGRPVRIDVFRAHLLSADPRLEVRGLVIDNPSWNGSAPMARIERLNASVRLWPLMFGRVDAPVVSVAGLALHLVRRRDGRANWTFGSGRHAGAAFAPLRRTERMSIRGGTLDLVDARRDVHFIGRFDQASSGRMPFAIAGTSLLAGVPARIMARGGPLNGSRIDDPYPFTAALVDGKTVVHARGTSGQPFDFTRFAVTFEATGPNLADIGHLFNLRLPNSAPFSLRTEASGDGPRFAFDRLRARLGRSDLAGRVRSDHSVPVPRAVAVLSSRVLTKSDVDAALSPVAPRAVARSRSGAARPQAAGRWLLSDAAFPVRNLGAVDVAAALHVDALQGYPVQLHRISTRLGLSNGKLTYDSLSAELYRGRLTGRIALDFRRAQPVLALAGTVRGVELGLMPQAARTKLSGSLDADLRMTGAGRSLHRAAASSTGSVRLRITGGTLPPAAGYMIGGDALRAIGSLGDSRKPMELDCAAARFAGASGRYAAAAIAVRTPAGSTGGSGWIDLGREQLRLTLIGQPRRRGWLHVAMPVSLAGPLRRPTATVLPGRNARKLGLRGALGVTLSPVAGILPMGREPAPPMAACRS